VRAIKLPAFEHIQSDAISVLIRVSGRGSHDVRKSPAKSEAMKMPIDVVGLTHQRFSGPLELAASLGGKSKYGLHRASWTVQATDPTQASGRLFAANPLSSFIDFE